MMGVSRGLEGRWMMNEGSGGFMYDISGRNNTSTLGGGAGWTSGQFGPATTYNALGEFASITPLPANLQITSLISIAMWIRPDNGWTDGAGGSQYDYLIDTSNDADGYTFQTGDSGIYISYIAHDWFSTISFTVGVWSHLAVVHDGTTLFLYKDATLVNSTAAASTASYASSTQLVFGNQVTSNNYFRGTMDDIRIYNRPLSITELRQIIMYPFSDFAYPDWALEAAFVSAAGDRLKPWQLQSQMGALITQ